MSTLQLLLLEPTSLSFSRTCIGLLEAEVVAHMRHAIVDSSIISWRHRGHTACCSSLGKTYHIEMNFLLSVQHQTLSQQGSNP